MNNCIILKWFEGQIPLCASNSNSEHWKILHTLIFNWNFQLLEYWRPLEALGKRLWNYSINENGFQKFLFVIRAWKKWFFITTTFLALADFWHFFRSDGSKNGQSQKVVIIKNQFFHARQPCKGIFEIYSQQCCNFITFTPGLLMAASIPGVENFS